MFSQETRKYLDIIANCLLVMIESKIITLYSKSPDGRILRPRMHRNQIGLMVHSDTNPRRSKEANQDDLEGSAAAEDTHISAGLGPK